MRGISFLRRSFTTAALLAWCFTAGAQIADDKCKFLGNIISGSTPSDFTKYWNQVSPENAGKWGSTEPTRDNMNWAQLDNAYQTAKSNGLPFKQHTFVWGQQQPNWIGTIPTAEQKEEVEEWIKLFCERFPDTDFIDVVNEPLHATPVYDQALGTGWNWVIWTFEKARQYCPKAKLILNDYNIVSSNESTTAYIALINMLKEKNLIDIIGEQGHFLETTPIATIKSNLNRLHATGLPIHISEFDVNIANDTEQRTKYQELFPALWEHAGVQGITLWGYRQGEIWRENAYLVRSDGTERPAMTWLKTYVSGAPGGTFCGPVTAVPKDDDDSFVSVYPNPAIDGKVYVLSPKDDAVVEVFNMQQQLVACANAPKGQHTSVAINGPPAIYVVKVVTGGKTVVLKMLTK